MRDDVTIRPADRSEADKIASMWEEAATRLKSMGINQWQYPSNREKIADDIGQGCAYLVVDGPECLGTITVDEFADPEFWLSDDFPDDALYAHRMIVRENAAGISLGVSMLDWASHKAAKMGKSWLRVDAWKTNPDLGRYYESQGFAHVRTVDLPHRRSGALYQRPAGSVTGVGPRYLVGGLAVGRERQPGMGMDLRGIGAGRAPHGVRQPVRQQQRTTTGNKIADQGLVRFPAYTPEERRRLGAVAHRLTTYWGQRVFAEAEDECRMRLCLAGYKALPESSAARP